MSRKVFLSFLGIGPRDGYREMEYTIKGQELPQTKFVQKAEYDFYGKDFFDKIIILVTKTSDEKYFDELNQALDNNAEKIVISEDLDPASQWTGFEEIIARISPNDQLYIDMTHGFRSVPIMFSVAINFLQQMKNIELKAVHYADIFKKGAPIVDFKEFFTLNRWSDAISRLVENADAKKLALVAAEEGGLNVADLNDPEIIDSFNKLTDAIRNVDVNNISEIASDAMNKIIVKKQASSKTESLLLDMVIEKFSSLTTEEPLNRKYDKDYFKIQLEIVKILLEHKLFMQAFTAMRELIGSFGLIKFENLKYNNGKGRKKRRSAELFINMFQYPEDEWKFDLEDPQIVRLMPLYNSLKTIKVEDILRDFVKEMTDLRNGFDHAWTGKNGAPEELKKSGEKYFKEIEKVYDLLVKHEILK